MRKNWIWLLLTVFLPVVAVLAADKPAQVEITVDAAKGKIPVSPRIYGRNNSLSDNPGNPVKTEEWTRYRDAGVRMFRECGGNNSTKYNWKLKLSSHPDWYNNVYGHDWDYQAKSLQDNMKDVWGMFGFQLIGWAAGTDRYNFDAGAFNNNQWSPAVNSNWAGGSGPGKKPGDPMKYLVPWSAADTTGILDHWFGPAGTGIGIDPEMFRIWDMDNEPEIWGGTHDDIISKPQTAEEFLTKYFAVAKEARKRYPGIRLAGPVTCNEWQWYNWNNETIQADGRKYVWIEYVIKRVAEEQKASGVKLLDILDLHFYPGEKKAKDILQLHRVWFDRTYNYPGANGLKRITDGGWDNSQTREYVFARCREWLDQYFGKDNGITLCVSEAGIEGNDPNVTALWYASTMGVFMDEGVEIFTPWTWKNGMWEALHLYSRYNRDQRVDSVSSDGEMVSAYSTVNAAGTAMTVMLVNREETAVRKAKVKVANLGLKDGTYRVKVLSGLPSTETFVSETQNALKETKVKVRKGSFTLDLPPLSVSAVLLD
jgi:hypothetical protein